MAHVVLNLAQNVCLNTPLSKEDPEIYALVQREQERQRSGLELIASEVCSECLKAAKQVL